MAPVKLFLSLSKCCWKEGFSEQQNKNCPRRNGAMALDLTQVSMSPDCFMMVIPTLRSPEATPQEKMKAQRRCWAFPNMAQMTPQRLYPATSPPPLMAEYAPPLSRLFRRPLPAPRLWRSESASYSGRFFSGLTKPSASPSSDDESRPPEDQLGDRLVKGERESGGGGGGGGGAESSAALKKKCYVKSQEEAADTTIQTAPCSSCEVRHAFGGGAGSLHHWPSVGRHGKDSISFEVACAGGLTQQVRRRAR